MEIHVSFCGGRKHLPQDTGFHDSYLGRFFFPHYFCIVFLRYFAGYLMEMLNTLRLLSPPYTFFTHGPMSHCTNHVVLSHKALTRHQICIYMDVCGYERRSPAVTQNRVALDFVS